MPARQLIGKKRESDSGYAASKKRNDLRGEQQDVISVAPEAFFRVQFLISHRRKPGVRRITFVSGDRFFPPVFQIKSRENEHIQNG